MSKTPLVSVIIPTYNRSALICDAVDSVLQQTYSNVEVIVVDDGSTDDTCDRLQPYEGRIEVIRQRNGGPASARNRGIAVAKGEIVAFLDSDDLWLPQKLERQVELLQQAGDSVPCCLCNISMRRERGEKTSFDIAWLKAPYEQGIWMNADEVLATRFVLFNQGIAIRRWALEKLGGFDESLRLLEDHDLSLRLSLEGPWAFIREPLVIWRETVGSLYYKAQRQELRVAELNVEVLERHRAAIADAETGRWRTIEKHLSREIRRGRREVAALKMSEGAFLGASIAGVMLRRWEQYRAAITRRSPWFPRMKAEGVPSFASR